MAYYDLIRSAKVFHKRVIAEDMENFASLYESDKFETGVSQWTRKHLFACRVICSKPQRRLALFVDGGFFPASPRGVHPYIDRLITGPMASFVTLSEPQIVQQSEPDSLGYIWAALAEHLRQERAGAATMFRAARQTTTVVPFGTMIPTASVQFGSSPPGEDSSSSSSESTTGYIETLTIPLVEEITVRLVSCLVRHVVNYGQPSDKRSPFIHFRDSRLTSDFQPPDSRRIRATDDGGLQFHVGNETRQVACLEAKRAFQALDKDGRPTISDQTLGQVVGEALVLHQDDKNTSQDPVTILAIQRWVKFLHFKMPPRFVREYETLPTTRAWDKTYLVVSSTDWFDINMPDHRKEIVSHILALVACADARQAGQG